MAPSLHGRAFHNISSDGFKKKVQPRWTNGFTNGSKKVRFENEDDRVAPKTNKKKKRKERNYSKKHRVFHGAHRVFDESTSAMKA